MTNSIACNCLNVIRRIRYRLIVSELHSLPSLSTKGGGSPTLVRGCTSSSTHHLIDVDTRGMSQYLVGLCHFIMMVRNACYHTEVQVAGYTILVGQSHQEWSCVHLGIRLTEEVECLMYSS